MPAINHAAAAVESTVTQDPVNETVVQSTDVDRAASDVAATADGSNPTARPSKQETAAASKLPPLLGPRTACFRQLPPPGAVSRSAAGKTKRPPYAQPWRLLPPLFWLPQLWL